MKKEIENPKVFISYAWGDEKYQSKVLAFAEDLVRDGVDVIFDKWDLSEGNDTYAFMEKCVKDPSITNVLLLLNQQYAEKADSREGGVGTETQIISPEIYNNTEQDKFIPIVFERGENGKIFKPTFLNSILYFDLTGENSASEYQRLVQRLYGIETYKKPELGNKPSWVDEDVPTLKKNRYDSLSLANSSSVKQVEFSKFLDALKDEYVNYEPSENNEDNFEAYYLSEYIKLKSLRDKTLLLMDKMYLVDDSPEMVADFFEDVLVARRFDSSVTSELLKTLIHELVIYYVAILFKQRHYHDIGEFFNRYFYVRNWSNKAEDYSCFYHYDQNLDNAIKHRDNKSYHSGTAQLWIENINISICTKSDFILADLICFNASVILSNKDGYHHWFPLSYIYDSSGHIFSRFSLGLKSASKAKNICALFGYNSINDFIERYKQIEDDPDHNRILRMGYSSAFEYAPTFFYSVKSTDIPSE